MLAGLTGTQSVEVMKAACYAGIKVLADTLDTEIAGLPEEEGYMPNGVKRNVVTKHQKEMLRKRLGISRIDSTTEKADVVVSFAGYDDKPTKKYPNGLPIPLLARSIESGSSVRVKNPFVRRAFNKASSEATAFAVEAGQNKVDELLRRL